MRGLELGMQDHTALEEMCFDTEPRRVGAGFASKERGSALGWFLKTLRARLVAARLSTVCPQLPVGLQLVTRITLILC